jgi:ATP-dependent exoDNAse (exonuclease V) beta subunit
LRKAGPLAVARQKRSFGGRASEKIPDALREARVGGGDAESEADARAPHREAVPLEMEVAAAVGTALHALLERFDWDADPGAEWARQRTWVHESLARRVSPSRLDAARDRATSLLERLESRSLWLRLRVLTPHVLARELPVLVRAEEGGVGAVAYVVGAIDLVYRDPDGGEVVVVDFKTDRIATAGAMPSEASHHRPQAGSIGARCWKHFASRRRRASNSGSSTHHTSRFSSSSRRQEARSLCGSLPEG